MSVFSANITHRSFYWQISALCFVLGLLLAAAAFTAKHIKSSGEIFARPGFDYHSPLQDKADIARRASAEEITKLRQRNTEMEKTLASGTGAAKELNKELQETKIFAGVTEVVGPGIQVTLFDSKRQLIVPSDQGKLNSLIHDSDIANVINEMRASGAEAIAVNGQRIVGSTPVRCVGPVVHINSEPATPPYTIQAIGDPKILFAGLNLQGGVLDGLRVYDQSMVRIEEKPKLRLPAFAGSTQMHFTHVVETASQDISKDTNK